MRLRGDIDLAHSLQGGQAFLWRREADLFMGSIAGRSWSLRQADDGIVAEGGPREEIASYLRLEPADAARRKRLLEDPALAPAMRALPGLRLLRQDPWETTVAFLTSANNNVLRIEGILRSLATRFGEPAAPPRTSPVPPTKDAETRIARITLTRSATSAVPRPLGADPVERRGLPNPDRLSRITAKDLRRCGLGYRAPFLKATARAVAAGDIDLMSLRGASWEEAREALLELPGVGPKVADCIALFSLDVDDAFPMDRWMLRAVAEVAGRELKAREAIAWARDRWGRDAGLAQQYLFHAIRMKAGAPGAARLAPRDVS